MPVEHPRIEVPDRIVIIDGELTMRDGSSLKEYLSNFQKDRGIKNGSSVNVLRTWVLQTLIDNGVASGSIVPIIEEDSGGS